MAHGWWPQRGMKLATRPIEDRTLAWDSEFLRAGLFRNWLYRRGLFYRCFEGTHMRAHGELTVRSFTVAARFLSNCTRLGCQRV